MQKIVTNLWFDTESEEAANYYCSIFPDSKITNISHYGEAGPREAGMVLTVDFDLAGQRFTAINGGSGFPFTEAISLLVNCESQEEVNTLWDKLVGDGGEEIQCGWLKDKYGLAWQIVPTAMIGMLQDKDPAKAEAAMKAMLQMKKIDVAVVKAAWEAA